MNGKRIGRAAASVAISAALLTSASIARGATADEVVTVGGSAWDGLLVHMVAAVVFGLTGMILFGLFLWLIVRLAPFSIRKEIEEDQNAALGIIVGSMILGIALIIAAAILG